MERLSNLNNVSQLYVLQHRWELEQPRPGACHLHVLALSPSSFDVYENTCVVFCASFP